MQDAEDTGGSSIANHRARVVLGVSGVDHDRFAHLTCQRDLRRKCDALGFAR